MRFTIHSQWIISMKAFVSCLFVFFCSPCFSAYLGPFTSRVLSVRNYNDIPRDKIDWKLYVTKYNISEQVLAGYMNITQEVGPLELTINLDKWSEGGFKKFLVDGMTTSNACTDREFKVIMENYNGTMNPECIFKPEVKFLKPFNIDVEMHKHVQEVAYGKFRVGLRFHAKGRDVMGFSVDIEFQKKKTKKHSP